MIVLCQPTNEFELSPRRNRRMTTTGTTQEPTILMPHGQCSRRLRSLPVRWTRAAHCPDLRHIPIEPITLGSQATIPALNSSLPVELQERHACMFPSIGVSVQRTSARLLPGVYQTSERTAASLGTTHGFSRTGCLAIEQAVNDKYL